MNRQKIFNTAYLGLKAQRFQRSATFAKEQACVYRSPEGLKCALGHCIPDELYNPGMEFQTPRGTLFANFPKLPAFFEVEDHHDVLFLADLQDCHDRADSSKEMRHRLKDFAKQHRLIIPK